VLVVIAADDRRDARCFSPPGTSSPKPHAAGWASSGEKINAGFTANALNYLLFLRLVPLFPFFLVNLAPAFTNIRLSTFVVGTFFGIIPATFVYVNLGQTLGPHRFAERPCVDRDARRVALLGILALVPVFTKKGRSARGSG
jgi:uncharacterized membrane protein YdjX (TVP38/TMEM64 family)